MHLLASQLPLFERVSPLTQVVQEVEELQIRHPAEHSWQLLVPFPKNEILQVVQVLLLLQVAQSLIQGLQSPLSSYIPSPQVLAIQIFGSEPDGIIVFEQVMHLVSSHSTHPALQGLQSEFIK